MISLRFLLASVVVAASLVRPAHAETIKIGVTPGPHAQILEAVKPIAARNGLDIQIVEFTDYVVPNAALDAGDLQANSFQNQPYLDNQKADRGYKIDTVALTVNFPMGVYSKKYKSWDAVPQGATVSIPNDPTNGGRVLLLLQDKGVLKLKPNVGFKPTVAPTSSTIRRSSRSWKSMPRKRRGRWMTSMRPASTPITRRRQAFPTKDAILREDPKGPYTNLIAVRSADKDKPWVKTLVQSYQTPEVREFVLTKFKGAVLPSW